MKKTKNHSRLDESLTSAFGALLLGSLNRMAVAEEALLKQHERSLALHERQIALTEKGVRASQDIASVTKHAYAQRLTEVVRAATGAEEAP